MRIYTFQKEWTTPQTLNSSLKIFDKYKESLIQGPLKPVSTFQELIEELASMPKIAQITEQQIVETRKAIEEGKCDMDNVLFKLYQRFAGGDQQAICQDEDVEYGVVNLATLDLIHDEPANSDRKVKDYEASALAEVPAVAGAAVVDDADKDSAANHDTDFDFDGVELCPDLLDDVYMDLMLRCDDLEWQGHCSPPPTPEIEFGLIMQALALLDEEEEENDS